MPERKNLLLALSIDVEEEGLFGGRYVCQNPQIQNTAYLSRLAPLLERGVKPTLFCAYSVFADAASRKFIARLRDSHGAEIGAHLHHWNTPPLYDTRMKILNRVPAANVADADMAAKLDNLLRIAQDFQGCPVTSFRMGRWDLHGRLWPMLYERGVLCDASIRPLHVFANPSIGPDHFDAPADPYVIPVDKGQILEVPQTVIPVLKMLASMPDGNSIGKTLRASLRHWGALALLPIQHPLWLMKLTTRLHAKRGGTTLSLTWHSSEMMPSGAPYMPDANSVDAFLKKMQAYLDWLYSEFHVTNVTMNDLASLFHASFPVKTSRKSADWTAGGGF